MRTRRTIAAGAALALAAVAAVVLGMSCSEGQSSASHPRMLVLGIDGMDYRLLTKFMEEGAMPNFSKLASRGGISPLWSSIPPQSPVAWSNFITGMNPGGHGIFDFIHRDPVTHLPEFSMAKVEPPPEELRFLGLGLPNKISLPFSRYSIPLAGGKTVLLRRGTAFWEILGQRGVPCTIFKIPSNFPPVECEARSISGMGTPDLLGTYGTFSYYTDDPPEGYEDISGGVVYPVAVKDGAVEAKLYGPANDFLDIEEMKRSMGREPRPKEKQTFVEFTVYVDPANPVAKIVVQNQELLLKEGEFSGWVKVSFPMLPGLKSVSGICRFYLMSVHPNFRLYVSPVNIDPSDPALPISHPSSYSKEIYESVGYFFTQGMAEETKALDHGIFSNGDFVVQSDLVLRERIRLLENELDRFDSGFLFFYFSSLDLSGHMMWSVMDEKHPAHDPAADDPYMNRYRELYVEMDRVLGSVMERLDEDDALIVMSDHGFGPWYKSFRLNTWLYENGYLVLEPGTNPEDVEALIGVDWRRTRAYALGINALYVNQMGRERSGTVSPGREKEELMGELISKLESFRDPETGEQVIKKVYRARDVYSGPYVGKAPDLIVGYAYGYRGADESALGEIPPEVLVVNTRKWGGDHAGDYTVYPGVLVTNRRIMIEDPALYDLTPTILAYFGIPRKDWMVGREVF